MEEIQCVSELLLKLQKKRIVIYGAGYVAKQFYSALKMYNMASQVVSFITSDGTGFIDDAVEVTSVVDLKKLSFDLICIAVHESLLPEIKVLLNSLHYNQYLWIYPFVYEMQIGSPVCEHKEVPVKTILYAHPYDYTIAARCMAIDEYYGRNMFGFEVYKKCLSSFSDEYTVEIRLRRFIELIQRVETYGFDSRKAIKIYTDYLIIDGAHRLSLACWKKKDVICCDLYDDQKRVHKAEEYLTRESATRFGITNRELRFLEQKQDDLLSYYNR